jgi:hypothetical protein
MLERFMKSRENVLSRRACDVLVGVVLGVGCLHGHCVRPCSLGGDEQKVKVSKFD